MDARSRTLSGVVMQNRENKKENLLDKLIGYSQTDYYPFHMPGHKRQSIGLPDPYTIDITEIDGFDNLNHPEEILLDLNHSYRDLYQTDEAYLMVNGSTGGNLAAIFASCKNGDGVLILRTAHKSIIHALMLKQLKVFYQIPHYENGITMGFDVDETERILEDHPEIKLMVITSPTYEGVLLNVNRIADVCHSHNVALIVDAAHGAHLGITERFPKNPIHEGADVVILSLHKMLPTMTQTAMVLYHKNPYVKKEELEESMRIFQTSSPSYVLMAGAAKCLDLLESKKEELFQNWMEQLEDFYEGVNNLGEKLGDNIEIMSPENRDPSKIVIMSRQPEITGNDLMKVLRERYHLEMEMAQGSYTLAMTSCMDTKEGYERLKNALLEINGMNLSEELGKEVSEKRNDFSSHEESVEKSDRVQYKKTEVSHLPEKRFELFEILDYQWEEIPYEDSLNRTVRDEVCIYPPGIPLVVPGEVMNQESLEKITYALGDGLHIDGVDKSGKIRVICE